jgi:class 3 adenylate cyclase
MIPKSFIEMSIKLREQNSNSKKQIFPKTIKKKKRKKHSVIIHNQNMLNVINHEESDHEESDHETEISNEDLTKEFKIFETNNEKSKNFHEISIHNTDKIQNFILPKLNTIKTSANLINTYENKNKNTLKHTDSFENLLSNIEIKNLPDIKKKHQEPIIYIENKKEIPELKHANSFKKIRKKKGLDFRIIEIKCENNKNRKILEINSSILYCDIRNFTFFCNNCPKEELPSIFMSEFSNIAEKIFKKWNATLTSTAGDSFVVIFPKKISEYGLEESFINALLCSIEFIDEMSNFLESKEQEYYPKNFHLGIETGLSFFYKLNDIIPIAVVSKTVNNAQRYEDHSKRSKRRKITISETTFNLIARHKAIKELFSLKSLLEAKGINGRPFVYSSSVESLRKFYKSDDWKYYADYITLRNQKKEQENDLNFILKNL